MLKGNSAFNKIEENIIVGICKLHSLRQVSEAKIQAVLNLLSYYSPSNIIKSYGWHIMTNDTKTTLLLLGVNIYSQVPSLNQINHLG